MAPPASRNMQATHDSFFFASKVSASAQPALADAIEHDFGGMKASFHKS